MDSFISIDFGTAAVAFESPAVGVASEAATAAPVLSRGTQAPSEAAVEAFQTAMAKPIADNAAVEVAFDSAVKAFNAAVAAVEKTVTPVVADVDSAVRDVQVAVDSVGRDDLIPPQQTVVPPPAYMTSRRVEVNAPYQAVDLVGRDDLIPPQQTVVPPSADMSSRRVEANAPYQAVVVPQAPVAVDSVVPQAPVAVDSVVPQAPVAVDSVGRDDLIPPQQTAVPPPVDTTSLRVEVNAPAQTVVVTQAPVAVDPVVPQAPLAIDQVVPQTPVAVDSVVPQAPVAVYSVGRDDLIPPQQTAIPPPTDMTSRRVEDNAPTQAVVVPQTTVGVDTVVPQTPVAVDTVAPQTPVAVDSVGRNNLIPPQQAVVPPSVDTTSRRVEVNAPYQTVALVGRDDLIPPQQTAVPPPADMTSRRVEVNAPYQAVVAPQAPVAVDQVVPQASVAVDPVVPQAPVAVDSVVPQPPVAVDSVERDDLIPPQQAAVPPPADMTSRRVADNGPVQAVAVSDVDEVSEARAENIIAAGVVPQQQIAAAVDSHVADPAGVQAVDAVSARTVEVAERVSKAMTASEVLIQAAEAVADTILVSPGLLRGEGEIRVQLRPDVLDGTEIRIGVAGRQLDVSFMPSNADMSALIEQCRPQLEQHLAARIHRFSVSVSVAKKSRSGDD